MQSTISSDSTRFKKSEVPMGSVDNEGGEETSGLYDLKALASSAKKHRSQRLTSEMDAQQSLLQSSATLNAVALPNPKRSREISVPVLAVDTPEKVSTRKSAESSAATAFAEPSAFSEEEHAAPSSKRWQFALATVLVAGAAAFYFLAGRPDSSSDAPMAALTAGGPESEPATPVQPLPALVDDAEEQADVAPEADLVKVTPLEVEAAKDAPSKLEEDDSKNKAESAKQVAAADTKSESQPARSNNDSDKGRPAAKASESKSKPAASKQEASKQPVKSEALDSNASVDDILSAVTGGIDKREAVVEDKGPSKKQLDRGDVAKAMKKISPAAKACYSVEEFSGMVSVKYSVEPNGKVSDVQPTGAHKSSKTGACVAKAVKGASFPAFDGSVTSFTFPVLLSP